MVILLVSIILLVSVRLNIRLNKTHGAGQLKRRMTMSDNVMLVPNILQPAAALKAYAPIGVKFWENQETALEGLKEFAGRPISNKC
jgi:hypothetical protein